MRVLTPAALVVGRIDWGSLFTGRGYVAASLVIWWIDSHIFDVVFFI
jgi:hypothetical protein